MQLLRGRREDMHISVSGVVCAIFLRADVPLLERIQSPGGHRRRKLPHVDKRKLRFLQLHSYIAALEERIAMAEDFLRRVG